MTLSIKALEEFVRVRNESEFSSNLQFQIDASSCGFSVKDLGDVTKTEDGGYYWVTPYGVLVETFGRMFLSEPHANEEYDIPYIVERARKLALREA